MCSFSNIAPQKCKNLKKNYRIFKKAVWAREQRTYRADDEARTLIIAKTEQLICGSRLNILFILYILFAR